MRHLALWREFAPCESLEKPPITNFWMVRTMRASHALAFTKSVPPVREGPTKAMRPNVHKTKRDHVPNPGLIGTIAIGHLEVGPKEAQESALLAT